MCIYGVMNLSPYSRPARRTRCTDHFQNALSSLFLIYFASRLSLSRPDAPVRPPRLVGLYSLQLVLPRLFPRAGLGSARGAPCECDFRSTLPREARAREPPMSRPNTLGAHACHMSSTFNRGPFGGGFPLTQSVPAHSGLASDRIPHPRPAPACHIMSSVATTHVHPWSA